MMDKIISTTKHHLNAKTNKRVVLVGLTRVSRRLSSIERERRYYDNNKKYYYQHQ
jgi:hypothetical protein